MSAEGPVVVLGAGASGEHFVGALRRLDKDVEIVVAERGLVGGECSFYACMPTKTLLRPGEALEAARYAPGAAEAVTGDLDVAKVLEWRDFVTSNRDDSWYANWLDEEGGAELIRGQARVVRPGMVEVDGRELEYAHLVVATGSEPAVPPIDGIQDVEYWTNREAVWADGPPESLVVLGAGPVGCELAQYFHRLGATVTVVASSRLLDRVDREAGELLRERFEDEGIALRFESKVERVEKTSSGVRLHTSARDAIEAERLLVATGRKPNVEGFGLEQLDVEISPRGIAVDERMRAGDRVWAVGDPTGVQLLTHVGKYQARVAAANIAGGDYVADYRAIPAAVFTDPTVATVGSTDDEGLVTATYRIEGGRLSTYERPKRSGILKLAADPGAGVLVGAVAVAPEAPEWLGQLTLAVRARVPMDVLLDTIQPYPTFSEAIFDALQDLEKRLSE
jgi:pyruvate/2-oxoglutarate dehydrogenase complex dihydrolipoamide dehydrogenase (E3) component